MNSDEIFILVDPVFANFVFPRQLLVIVSCSPTPRNIVWDDSLYQRSQRTQLVTLQRPQFILMLPRRSTIEEITTCPQIC